MSFSIDHCNSRVLRSLAGGMTALAVGATLAACSSSSPKADTSTTQRVSSDSTLANSELASASAYPAGWQSQGAGSGDTQASLFASETQSEATTLADCLGVAPSLVNTKPAEAAGPTYADSTGKSSITESVEVFPQAAQAQAETQAVAGSKAPSCLKTDEESQIQGSGLSGLSIATLSVPAVGEHIGAVTIHATVTENGQSESVVVVNVVIQSGRSEAVVQYAAPGPGVSQSIIDSTDQPMAAALTTK